jgi:hypothetical protein
MNNSSSSAPNLSPMFNVTSNNNAPAIQVQDVQPPNLTTLADQTQCVYCAKTFHTPQGMRNHVTRFCPVMHPEFGALVSVLFPYFLF